MSKDIYRTYSIYKITNSLNGRSYVGQTTEPPARRFSGHCKNKEPTPVDKALQDLGRKNFDFEILHEFKNVRHPTLKEKQLRSKLRKKYKCSMLTLMTREEHLLNFAEIFWIAVHDTKENGYNETIGGTSANFGNSGWKGIPLWRDTMKERWENSDESKGRPWVSPADSDELRKCFRFRGRTLRGNHPYAICDRWSERGVGFVRFYYECYITKPKWMAYLVPLDKSKPLGPDNFRWQCPQAKKEEDWEKSYGKPWVKKKDHSYAHGWYVKCKRELNLSSEWNELLYGWQRFYWECYPTYEKGKCLISTDGSPVIGKDNFKWVDQGEVWKWNQSLPKEASAA